MHNGESLMGFMKAGEDISTVSSHRTPIGVHGVHVIDGTAMTYT